MNQELQFDYSRINFVPAVLSYDINMIHVQSHKEVHTVKTNKGQVSVAQYRRLN